MAVKDSATEQLIIDTAKKIFFAEGRFNATTQNIADAAGVNRTLLNYYFRSRDTLFTHVLRDAKLNMDKRLDTVLSSDKPFRQKIEHFIDIFLEQAKAYPYLDTYFISQMNNPDVNIRVLLDFEPIKERMDAFMGAVEIEIINGTLRDASPRDFFINLISLIAHPMAMQAIFKDIFTLDELQFQTLLKNRKEVILKLLFKE
jgi:AcrR family transcriptional regulator